MCVSLDFNFKNTLYLYRVLYHLPDVSCFIISYKIYGIHAPMIIWSGIGWIYSSTTSSSSIYTYVFPNKKWNSILSRLLVLYRYDNTVSIYSIKYPMLSYISRQHVVEKYYYVEAWNGYPQKKTINSTLQHRNVIVVRDWNEHIVCHNIKEHQSWVTYIKGYGVKLYSNMFRHLKRLISR